VVTKPRNEIFSAVGSRNNQLAFPRYDGLVVDRDVDSIWVD
jgi:hypothetical protein